MSEPSKRTSGPVQRNEEMSEPSKPTSGPGQRYGISSFANLPQPRGAAKNKLVLKSLFSLPGNKIVHRLTMQGQGSSVYNHDASKSNRHSQAVGARTEPPPQAAAQMAWQAVRPCPISK
ncbi:hypothetical protein Peur_012736 [Populus x canadensis]